MLCLDAENKFGWRVTGYLGVANIHITEPTRRSPSGSGLPSGYTDPEQPGASANHSTPFASRTDFNPFGGPIREATAAVCEPARRNRDSFPGEGSSRDFRPTAKGPPCNVEPW